MEPGKGRGSQAPGGGASPGWPVPEGGGAHLGGAGPHLGRAGARSAAAAAAMAGAARPGGPGPRPRALLQLLLLGTAAASVMGAQVTSETKEVPENQPADIPCAAFSSSWSNPRIEWKFQKGSSLILLYWGGMLTDPYKERVQFSRTGIRLERVTRGDTGRYICEVVGDGGLIAKSEVNLIVQVPPSKPVAHVPSSATIGSRAVLRCTETEGSPPPTFRWFRDGMAVPPDPKSSPSFRNSSYTLDPATGELIFEPLSAFDTGEYFCEASNKVGSPQQSDVFRMEASEVNVGGIVAAVVVLLMVLGLIAFGLWFAYRRGFFSKRKDTTGKKVIYSQPSHRSEGEFKQTSSFLV